MNKLYIALLTALVLFAVAYKLSESPTYERDDFERVTHTIGRGEAAWDYAERYCPSGMDKREYLELCARENGMEGMMGHINYGESYMFLRLKEENKK